MGESSNEIKKVDLTLPAEWHMNNVGLDAINRKTLASQNSSHGIVSSIPIVCKGKGCPYIETCPMETLGVDVDTLFGQRCPVEISQLTEKFAQYVDYFEIDADSADIVILSLIRDLIDYEIQSERASKIMAIDGSFLEDVTVGIDSNGRAIKNKEISKASEYKDKVNAKKSQILQLLNSTPKDKAGQKLNLVMDPSTYAAQLMRKAEELEEEGSIIKDAEYTDVEVEDGE